MDIAGTIKTPAVNIESGRMQIAGRSILEDSSLFYSPLNELLEETANHSNRITRIDLGFEYLNGSSVRCLASMIRILEKVYDQGNNIVINWYYYADDESMYDVGKLLQSLTRIPFNIIMKD